MDSFTFSGRARKPLWKKLTGMFWWWWMNDDNQTVDQATWYHREWPQWRRWLVWNVFRNPLQNFRAFVVGVQDRNYTVIGKYPVQCVQRDDLIPPETGWQYCLIKTAVPLPFVSYSGKRILWYAGWQPSGFFGFKINFHQSV